MLDMNYEYIICFLQLYVLSPYNFKLRIRELANSWWSLDTVRTLLCVQKGDDRPGYNDPLGEGMCAPGRTMRS
jgi:hypothetical protein